MKLGYISLKPKAGEDVYLPLQTKAGGCIFHTIQFSNTDHCSNNGRLHHLVKVLFSVLCPMADRQEKTIFSYSLKGEEEDGSIFFNTLALMLVKFYQ